MHLGTFVLNFKVYCRPTGTHITFIVLNMYEGKTLFKVRAF